MLDFQDQILVGTILGGSSLSKPPKGVNFYLSMRSQNKMWLRYKMEEMGRYYREDSKICQYGKTHRANSPCNEKLTTIYHMLYCKNRRTISMDVLDQLMDIGLAVWYLDSGGKTGRNKKNAYLNVTKFKTKGAKIIERYFNEVGMACKINCDGSRLKIVFSVKGTVVLFKTIAHQFPEFMIPQFDLS